MVTCGGEKRIKLGPESGEFYEYGQLIMTREEKNIFRHLPDEDARKAFIRDFWAKRDPDPDTEENEYREEFFRRIEYANQRFKEGPPGWKTDRGRIYIYLGAPDKVDEIFTHSEFDFKGQRIRGSVLIWIYYRYQLGIKFVDKDGTHHFTLDPAPFEMGGGIVGSLTDAIDMAKLGVNLLGEGGLPQRYADFKAHYDRKKREIVVAIPVKAFQFLAEEGMLKADLKFEFHIYEKDGPWTVKFEEARSFARPEKEVLNTEEIVFVFPCELKSGRYYFDVVIFGKESLGKTRKVFHIKA